MCQSCPNNPESVKVFTLQYKLEGESVWQWVTQDLGVSYPAPESMTFAATLDDWHNQDLCSGQTMRPIFFTGKEASTAKDYVSLFWNDRTFRLMPIATPMMRGNGESLASYAEKRNNWKARESARFETGFYTATPFAGESWFDEVHSSLSHFLHVSRTDKTRVSFTESEEKGIADRQTAPMNIGRYFTRFASEYGLTPERIASLSVQYSKVHGEGELGFKIAMTPDEIEAAYTHGEANRHGQHSPTSCMSYDAHKFSSSQHPTRVYGAGDLGVAYLIKGERCTARAIVWPEKKIYSRIYGDVERLEPLLIEAGYYDGSLKGARLLRIKDSGAYVMPYVDGDANEVKESDCGKYFILCTYGGEFSAQNTNGLAGEYEDDYCTCERCNRRVHNDDSYYIDSCSENWCERCYSAHAMCCTACMETCDDDSAVRMANGGYICSGCAENTFVCGDDGERYPDDENSGLENESGEPIAQCNAHLYFICSELQDDVARLRGDSYRTGELYAFEGEGEELPLCMAGYDAIKESGDEARIANLETVQERRERLEKQLSFLEVLESRGFTACNPSLDEIAEQAESMIRPIDYNHSTGQIEAARYNAMTAGV